MSAEIRIWGRNPKSIVMKRETKILMGKATDSLFLSIDHFNRPYDRGRHEAVLIFLDRAFELLLKSVIVHRGGMIRGERENLTIGFDRCVRKCVSDNNIRCLSEEDALTIQNINTLRDAAQHYLVDLGLRAAPGTCMPKLARTRFRRVLHHVYARKHSRYIFLSEYCLFQCPPRKHSRLYLTRSLLISRDCVRQDQDVVYRQRRNCEVWPFLRSHWKVSERSRVTVICAVIFPTYSVD